MKFLYLLALIISYPFSANGQALLINEVTLYEPSLRDEDGANESGWVELKNVSDSSVVTKNLILSLNDTLRWSLPSIEVQPDSFVFIWLSGKDRYSNPKSLHANFVVKNIPNNIFKLITNNTDKPHSVDSVRLFSKLDWYESYSRFHGNLWYHVTTRTPGYDNEQFGYWKRLSSTAPFQPRDSAPDACLYFKDKFWILSGWTGDSYNPNNEVWMSDNLTEWEMVNAAGPYKGDANFIVFNDRMWAFDGNAYSSTDGVHWNKVATDLPFAVANRIAEFQGKLWVVKNRRVYSSVNGINWQLQLENAPWEDRELPGFLPFRDKLWYFGGAKAHQSINPGYRDIWSSSDGTNWELVTNQADWPGRAWFTSAVFDNKMWILGGWDYWQQDDTNNVWYSEDGVHWKELKSSSIWSSRHASYKWVARGALWISSGYSTLHYGLFNDVWKLDSLATYTTNTYYLKNQKPVADMSSWGNNPDGTGFYPKGFSFDNQKFIISNNRDVIIHTYWEVTGSGSGVEVGNAIDSISVEISKNVKVVGKMTLNSKSSLVLKNSQSPLIEKTHEESQVIIDTDTLQYFAANEVSSLVLASGVTNLTLPTKIKKSVIVGNGALHDLSDTELAYEEGAVLKYQSDLDYLRVNSEIPRESPPTKVIVNCNCVVSLDRSLDLKTVEFQSGKIEIDDAFLKVDEIVRVNEASYFVTKNRGKLVLTPKKGQVFFPIGTNYSYDPLLVSTNARIELGASVIETDTSQCSPSHLNIAWELSSLYPVQNLVATFQWEESNIVDDFEAGDLAIAKLPTTPDGLSIVRDAEYVPGEQQITSEIDFHGIFAVVDLTSECLNFSAENYTRGNTHHIYPNPNSGKFYLPESLTGMEIDRIEIWSSNGKLVQIFEKFGNPSDNSIDISGRISPGIYILKVRASDQILFFKLQIV